MSTIDASYASSRDLALLSNIFVPSYTYDPTNFTFQVQLDTYLQGTVNIGSSNTDYKFNINGNPYVQVTVSDWAKAPAIATVDMSAYRITQLGNQVESDNTSGLPAISFYNDPTTGIYSDGPGRVGILSQNVSALMVTAGGLSNRSITSNSIGGVTLSGSQIVTGAGSNNVGGVTLNAGSITTQYGSLANINGVLLDRDRVFTIFDASSSIAGVTLSSGTVISVSATIGGVSISGTRINALGPSIVGGVNMSSGTINATNPTNNHYIGNVRIQGDNIYGILTSGTIVALSNTYGTSNKGGGIQFFNGKLLVNTSDAVDPVGQFNVSMGNAPAITPTTMTWSSNYALFGPDITSTTGPALGLGYDKTNGVARIVSAQPASGALKDMVISARNLSLAVTQLTVCGAIVNPSASPSFIGGVSLTDSLVGGVSISSGGIFTPTPSVVNTIGGVTLADGKVTAGIINTGVNTAQSVVSLVTLDNGKITAPGTNSVISKVVLNEGRIGVDGATWVAIGTNAGLLAQGSNAVAIGTTAGYTSQQQSSIAIGSNAGSTSQGNSLAPGVTATGFAVAIGAEAGATNQAASAVAIGGSAGRNGQKFGSVAIGNNAASSFQGLRSIAIGDHAANVNQSGGAVAIGTNAGRSNQGGYSIAIGASAGATSQFSNSIVLNATGADLDTTGTRNYQNTSGFFVAPVRASTTTGNASDVGVIAWNPDTQEIFSVKNGAATLGGVAFSNETIVAGTGTSSIGGVTMSNGFIVPNRGSSQIAIGSNAGVSNQFLNSVAIGTGAGSNFQNFEAVAIGYLAATSSQAAYAVAIGKVAGSENQGQYSVAIGFNSANLSQGSNAIAMGRSAGANRQGNGSIAIGTFAGVDDQVANSIILNATEVQVDAKNNSGFYVAPIRPPTDAGYSVLGYNPTSKEIVNTAGAGATIGGVTLSAGALTGVTTIQAGIGSSSVGGVTLVNNGVVATNITATGTISGGNLVGTAISAGGTSYVGGVTLSAGALTGVTTIQAGTGSSAIGGVTLSDGQITATGVLSTIGGLSIVSGNNNLFVNIASGVGPWISVACSADGQTIFGVRNTGTTIYISRNRGVTWINNTSLTTGNWSTVACSSNGQVVVATQNTGGIGSISAVFISTNGGVTWSAGTQPGGSVNYTASAVSGDGSTIVVGVNGGGVYRTTSISSFTTWTRLDSTNSRNWSSLALSSNGSTIVGTASGIYTAPATPTNEWLLVSIVSTFGSISLSSDGTKGVVIEANYLYVLSGGTWSAKLATGMTTWSSSKYSADGTTIVATTNTGSMYKSLDAGASLTLISSGVANAWSSVACSSDGTKIVASQSSGYVWLLEPPSLTFTSQATIGGVTLNAGALTNVTTISAGPGTSYVSGVTLNAGALTNVTTISAGPGTSYVGGVTLTGGQITAMGGLSTIGPLSITSESTTLLENTGSGSGEWVSVASSADGQTIFGVRYNGTTIYISRNRGLTWVNNTSLTNGFWSTVACSSNGQVVVATQNTGGIAFVSAVFISTNGGVTWGAGTQPGGSVDYLASAVSGDGSTIVVGVTLGGVYRITSADSFTTWTRLDASNNRQWKALAISSNGVTLVGCATFSGFGTNTYILKAPAGGATTAWTQVLASSVFSQPKISISSDGTKGVAFVTNSPNVLYLSTDSGTTWSTNTASGSRSWSSVAYSGGGTTIIGATSTGGIYTSVNGGTSWNEIITGSTNWTSVGCSADGAKIVASANPGYIWLNYMPASASVVFTGTGVIGGVTLDGGTVLAPSTSNSTLTLSGLPSVAYNTATGAFVQRGLGQIIAYGSIVQGVTEFAVGATVVVNYPFTTITFNNALPDSKYSISAVGSFTPTYIISINDKRNDRFAMISYGTSQANDINFDFTVVY